MVNVVVPITNNAKRYKKILSSLSRTNDIVVFVGIVSSQINELNFLDSENIYIIEFQDGSKMEEIINGLQKYISVGSIMIMRKPISENEFNSFVNNNKDIVTCRRNLGSFKSILFNFWQKILKTFLGVRLYEGDTSVIYFAEDIASVILSSSNLSYNSRVDRWRGVEQGTVIVEGEGVKTETDKKANIRNLIISLIAIAVAVSVTTVVSIFARVNLIVGLLLFCLDFIALAIVLILLVITIFNNMVGKKQFGYALDISQNEEIDDETNEEYVENEDDILEEGEDE